MEIHCDDVTETKKADAAEHPKVFHRVGLLVNEPPDQPGCSLFSHPRTSIRHICSRRKFNLRLHPHSFYLNYRASDCGLPAPFNGCQWMDYDIKAALHSIFHGLSRVRPFDCLATC